VGGLDFHLSRSWRVWGNGGVEFSDYEEESHIVESVNTGIGYTSRNTLLSLTYQRGLTSEIGIPGLLQSDIANASLGYRITRRIDAKLESYYYRSSEQNGDGLLKALLGGGGLEFALRRDLLMSMHAYYQHQQAYNFSSFENLGLNCFTGYLGFQYVFPALRRSGN